MEESSGNRVRIELQTTIDDNGQMEYNTIKQTGNFYKKDNVDVLTFDEELADTSIVRNFITIQPEKVNIKRTGNISMHQKFHNKEKTENMYKHPHGFLHMETYTSGMDYQPASSGNPGRLRLDYTVKLNGQEERIHQLTLTFSEECTQ